MFVREILWRNLHLAPDDGSGGGGSLMDGSGEGGGEEGVVEGGEGAAAATNPYADIESRYGGRDGIASRLQQWERLNQGYQSNPQFKQTIERALQGDYGPAAQQKAEQQVAEQQGQQQGGQKPPDLSWLKYDSNKMASLRGLHDKLLDPAQRDQVLQDPANKQLVEDYYKHHDFMQRFWWDPQGWADEFDQHPGRVEARQKEIDARVKEAVGPMQQAFDVYRGEQFYQSNRADIDALPQAIQDGITSGGYGPLDTHEERVAAMQKAIAYHKQLIASGQAPPQPGQGEQTNVNGTQNANAVRTPVKGQPPRPNAAGGGGGGQKGKDGARKFGESFAQLRRES